MCLIVVAFQQSRSWPILLAANRDEFHARPRAPLQLWDEQPDVAAGRDLQAGGTWVAASARGRFAALTNARLGRKPRARTRTRGALVLAAIDELEGSHSESKVGPIDEYGPFGLLDGDTKRMRHRSNAFEAVGWLTPGVHVLSNGPMNAPWPKAEQVKRALSAAIADGEPSDQQLFAIMSKTDIDDRWPLPDTGIGDALERHLAPVFIKDPVYGTRATTLLRISADNLVEIAERRYNASGDVAGQTKLEAVSNRWRRVGSA